LLEIDIVLQILLDVRRAVNTSFLPLAIGLLRTPAASAATRPIGAAQLLFRAPRATGAPGLVIDSVCATVNSAHQLPMLPD
jgi:hypothetical protein